jgi:hypothetical protein
MHTLRPAAERGQPLADPLAVHGVFIRATPPPDVRDAAFDDDSAPCWSAERAYLRRCFAEASPYVAVHAYPWSGRPPGGWRITYSLRSMGKDVRLSALGRLLVRLFASAVGWAVRLGWQDGLLVAPAAEAVGLAAVVHDLIGENAERVS